jgi:hypothetical protein
VAIDGQRHTLLPSDGRADQRGLSAPGFVARSVGQRNFRSVARAHRVPGADRPGDPDWHGSVLMDTGCDLEGRYGARAEFLSAQADLQCRLPQSAGRWRCALAHLGRISPTRKHHTDSGRHQPRQAVSHARQQHCCQPICIPSCSRFASIMMMSMLARCRRS